MYNNKAIWWIGRDNPAWAIAEIEQAKRMPTDVWHEPISKFVEWMPFVTAGEILAHLKIDVKDQKNSHQKQVTGILKQLGFQRKQKKVAGKNISGWERLINQPTFKDAQFEEMEPHDIPVV